MNDIVVYNDIIYEIFKWLPLNDSKQFSCVNKLSFDIFNNSEVLWEHYLNVYDETTIKVIWNNGYKNTFIRYHKLNKLIKWKLKYTISQLHNLQQLNLSHNQNQLIPPEIGQLHNLQELSLSNNQIQLIPPEIGQLHNLQKLELNNNQIQFIPPEIGQLHNLQQLSLSHNKIQLIPSGIGQLHNLQQLYLDGNKIQLVSPDLKKIFGNRLFL